MLTQELQGFHYYKAAADEPPRLRSPGGCFTPFFSRIYRRIDFHAFTFYQRNYIFPAAQRSKCASLRGCYIQPVVGRLICDMNL